MPHWIGLLAMACVTSKFRQKWGLVTQGELEPTVTTYQAVVLRSPKVRLM